MTTIICGIFLALGLLLLGFAVRQYLSTKEMLQTGVRTTAVVLRNDIVRSSDDGSDMYQPVMTYWVNGKETEFVSNFRSNPPAYKSGDKVEIVYDAADHLNVKIISYWGLYLVSIILTLFALPMIVVCGGYFLFKAGML